jgi:hypothetical protein
MERAWRGDAMGAGEGVCVGGLRDGTSCYWDVWGLVGWYKWVGGGEKSPLFAAMCTVCTPPNPLSVCVETLMMIARGTSFFGSYYSLERAAL